MTWNPGSPTSLMVLRFAVPGVGGPPVPRTHRPLKLRHRYIRRRARDWRRAARVRRVAMIPEALRSTMVHRCHMGEPGGALPHGEHTDARGLAHIEPVIHRLRVHVHQLRILLRFFWAYHHRRIYWYDNHHHSTYNFGSINTGSRPLCVGVSD